MGTTTDKLRAVEADFKSRVGGSPLGQSAFVTPQGLQITMVINGSFPFAEHFLKREIMPDEALLKMAQEVMDEIKKRGLNF